jgi:hypothetical protein
MVPGQPGQKKKVHDTPPQWKKAGHNGVCLSFHLMLESVDWITAQWLGQKSKTLFPK